MNASYQNWKQNYENEFESHREKNYRLVYPYQSEYDYYHDHPDWIMVGDFCNFHRKGTLHIGEEITAKYEKLMLDDINIFRGFCRDEFERIRVYLKYHNPMAQAKKIFEYDNMSVRYETLSVNQRWVFRQELDNYLKTHEEDIDLIKRFDDLH